MDEMNELRDGINVAFVHKMAYSAFLPPPVITIGTRRRCVSAPRLSLSPLVIDPFKTPSVPPVPTNSISPIIILPGYLATPPKYVELKSHLQALLPETPIHILPTTTRLWLSTLGGRPVTPILSLLHSTLQSLNTSSVTLVAHSASGWISRIYLSGKPYDGNTWTDGPSVRRLICLGTPHMSDEPFVRKNMTFVKNECLDTNGMVCLAGDGGSDLPGFRGWICKQNYKVTAGGSVGDGVVPLDAAFLDGATNVRLKGVWHSSGEDELWYGHEKVVRYWSQYCWQ